MTPYELYCQLQKEAALKPGVKLNEHQNEAIQRVHENNGSLLIAHGTGTGKTGTSVGAVEHLREKGRAAVTLAITPAALRDNYIDNGVHKFSDRKGVRLGPKGESGSFHVDHPKLPKADYYTVSIEMFRKNPHKYIDKLKADTIVWDEAHKGREKATQNYAAMMAVRPKVKNFIALSGTPIMNHPKDILPILDITTNKSHKLGDHKTFEKYFVGKSVKHHGPLGAFGIGPTSSEDVIRNKDYLKSELKKHVHYVPAEEVASMPEKVVHDVEVPMSKDQTKLYNFALKKVDPITHFRIKHNLPVGASEARHIFTQMMQARQVSNSLHTLDAKHTPATSAQHAPKAKRVIDDVHAHLAENPKHKAIVYTNLVHGGVDTMYHGLKEKGHDPGLFIGSAFQKKEHRDAHVKDFLAGKRRIMIINTAGTEGLNLPGATAHFTLDPHYNPAVTEQAEARGIRADSPVDKVHVYRYKSVPEHPYGFMFKRPTGIDEYVYNLADRKEKLNKQFLELMKREPKTKSAAALEIFRR